MRRAVVILGTVLILAFLGVVLKRLWLDHGMLWTVPLVFAAILGFAYAMSDEDERAEFRAVARWPLERLGLARPPADTE